MQALPLPSFSQFVSLSTDTNAWLVQAVVALSYVLFYTAYDKSTKQLSLSLLLDFLLVRPGPTKNRGLIWTLNEWNKLISLVAITSLGLCLLPLPFFYRISSELAASSAILIVIHSAYSLLRYYGVHDKLPAFSDMINLLNRNPSPKLEGSKRLVVSLRTIAWVSGAAAILVLPFSFVASAVFPLVLLLSLSHFWFMEVDYKLKLTIRPYAYVAFVIGGLALVSAVFQ